MSVGVDIRGPLNQLAISVAQKDALNPATYAGMSVRCYDASPPFAEFCSDGSSWHQTGGSAPTWDTVGAGANATANLAISPGTTNDSNVFGGHTDIDGGRNTADPTRSGAVRVGLNSSAAVIRAASLYKGYDLNAWGNAVHTASTSTVTIGGAGSRLVSISDNIDTIALAADMNQSATELFLVSSGSAFSFISGGNLDVNSPTAVADGDIWWALRSDITGAKWKLTKLGATGGGGLTNGWTTPSDSQILGGNNTYLAIQTANQQTGFAIGGGAIYFTLNGYAWLAFNTFDSAFAPRSDVGDASVKLGNWAGASSTLRRWAGLYNGGCVTGGARVVSATSATVDANTDRDVILTNTAARAVTLPDLTTVCPGAEFWIKDGAGTAASANITITPTGTDTIDGAANYVISTNKAAVRVVATTSGWFVVA